MGLIGNNDARVWWDTDLAICKGIQGIYCLVCWDSRRQLHQQLHILSSIVCYTFYLDLARIICLQYAVHQLRCGDTVRYILNGYRLLVHLLYARTHAHLPATVAIVVVIYIYHATCEKVGEQLKFPAFKVLDSAIYDLAKVMRQYFSTKAYRNTVCALCQQQRKLHGQRHRLILTSIVAQLPLGGLGIKCHLQRKFRQPRLYVTSCGRTVSRAHIAPVTLCFYQ